MDCMILHTVLYDSTYYCKTLHIASSYGMILHKLYSTYGIFYICHDSTYSIAGFYFNPWSKPVQIRWWTSTNLQQGVRMVWPYTWMYTGVGWLVHQLYQAMVGAKPHTGCLTLTTTSTTRPDSFAIGILCTVYSSWPFSPLAGLRGSRNLQIRNSKPGDGSDPVKCYSLAF